MKATGIIRRFDDLGRLHVKEVEEGSFKCRNKKEVLEAIEHLAEDFRKEINEKK